MPRFRTHAAALAAVALTAPAAAAAPAVVPPEGWTAPAPVPGVPGSGGTAPVAPALLVDPSGRVAALVAGPAGVVEVAARPPGGAWHDAPGSVPAAAASAPLTASTPEGAAVALWRRKGAVLASWRPRPGRPWSAPARLGGGAREVALAVAPTGAAVAAWIARGRAVAALRGAQGWGPARQLGPAVDAGDDRSLGVAIGPDGTAAVAFPGARGRMVALRAAGTDRFSAAQDVAEGAGTGAAPALVVGRDGAVLAAWDDDEGVQVAERPPGASGFGEPVRAWTCAARAGGACADIGPPALMVDGAGRGTVAFGWREGPATGEPVRAVVRSAPDAAWVDSGDFFGGFHPVSPPLLAVAGGRVTAVWGSLGSMPGDGAVQVADLAPGADRWAVARYLFAAVAPGARPGPGAPSRTAAYALAGNATGALATAWVAWSGTGGRSRGQVLAAVAAP